MLIFAGKVIKQNLPTRRQLSQMLGCGGSALMSIHELTHLAPTFHRWPGIFQNINS